MPRKKNFSNSRLEFSSKRDDESSHNNQTFPFEIHLSVLQAASYKGMGYQLSVITDNEASMKEGDFTTATNQIRPIEYV